MGFPISSLVPIGIGGSLIIYSIVKELKSKEREHGITGNDRVLNSYSRPVSIESYEKKSTDEMLYPIGRHS